MESKQIKFFPNYTLYKDGKIYSKNIDNFIKINDYRGIKTIKLYNNGLCKTYRISDLIKLHFQENQYEKVCYADDGRIITETQEIITHPKPFKMYMDVISSFNKECRIKD
jgi:hypothetical protein